MMFDSDQFVDLLLFNYSRTLESIREAVSGIPEDRFAECLVTAPNHPAWTLGHLACSAAFLGLMLEEPYGEAFNVERPVFAAGSKPVTNGNYGTRAELLQRLEQRHQLLAAAVKSKHGEYFSKPTPERLLKIVPTIGHLAVYLLASHEHYHLAQIKQWKKAAGFE